MDWHRGIDRLAWYAAGVAFPAILGAMPEDAWDDDEWGAVTSMEWTMFGGGSAGPRRHGSGRAAPKLVRWSSSARIGPTILENPYRNCPLIERRTSP